MKKHILYATAAVAIIAGSSFTTLIDCADFEQFNQGVTYTMSNYNGKGKLESRIDCEVKTVTKTPESSTADIDAKFFDGKGKDNGSASYSLMCKGGTYSVDMRNFVTPEMKSGAKDMDIKLEGTMLEYPSDMKAGSTLPNGTMSMIASQNGQEMSTTTVVIKDRKCEAIENKTTPAGTWECYKITYTQEVTIKTAMMSIPMKPRTVTEWFSFKVGAVRTESYRKDELEMYSELTKFTKPQ